MTITMIIMVIIIKYFFIPFKGKVAPHMDNNIKYIYKRLGFKNAQQHTGKAWQGALLNKIYITYGSAL